MPLVVEGGGSIGKGGPPKDDEVGAPATDNPPPWDVALLLFPVLGGAMLDDGNREVVGCFKDAEFFVVFVDDDDDDFELLLLLRLDFFLDDFFEAPLDSLLLLLLLMLLLPPGPGPM
jgi:hypothetical protein